MEDEVWISVKKVAVFLLQFLFVCLISFSVCSFCFGRSATFVAFQSTFKLLCGAFEGLCSLIVAFSGYRHA